MAGQTAAEIINHHMTNLSIGEGFYSLHIDTLFFSILLGGLFCWWMHRMALRSLQHVENNEAPSFGANVAEMIFEFIDGTIKDFFGKSRADIGSLAFTIFCWVLLWNVMDMMPVDFLPGVAAQFGIHHLKTTSRSASSKPWVVTRLKPKAFSANWSFTPSTSP